MKTVRVSYYVLPWYKWKRFRREAKAICAAYDMAILQAVETKGWWYYSLLLQFEDTVQVTLGQESLRRLCNFTCDITP